MLDWNKSLRYIVAPFCLFLLFLALLRPKILYKRSDTSTQQPHLPITAEFSSFNRTEFDNIKNASFYELWDSAAVPTGVLTAVPTAVPAAVPTVVPPRALSLKAFLNCADKALINQTIQFGDYWLLQNYIRGSKSTNMGCAEAITYTTTADYGFLFALPKLISRWLAPVSIALYAPGFDLNATLDSLQYMLNCLPESRLIQEFVTFHIFLHAEHVPSHISLEKTNKKIDCDSSKAPYLNVDRSKMYKTLNNLTYPINVGRNIARRATNTHFILASDLELLPSLDLSNKFLDMVFKNHSVLNAGQSLRVFPLAVFEVDKNATLPGDKAELLELFRRKKAISFHDQICAVCHRIPSYEQWVESVEENNELSVFSVSRRLGKFAVWEPFYISDNREPMFDERFTWEGNADKRIQGYAMCMLDYQYHVLQSAFLVHSPGIKSKNENSNSNYQQHMTQLIAYKIKPEYRIIYGDHEGCTV